MLAFDIMHKNEKLYSIEFTKQSPIVKRFTDRLAYKQFYTDTPSAQEIIEWFEGRCFPKTRDNKDEILKVLGLKEYDPLDIIRITHGVLFDDYIWIKFKGEDITYDQVKIRD